MDLNNLTTPTKSHEEIRENLKKEYVPELASWSEDLTVIENERFTGIIRSPKSVEKLHFKNCTFVGKFIPKDSDVKEIIFENCSFRLFTVKFPHSKNKVEDLVFKNCVFDKAVIIDDDTCNYFNSLKFYGCHLNNVSLKNIHAHNLLFKRCFFDISIEGKSSKLSNTDIELSEGVIFCVGGEGISKIDSYSNSYAIYAEDTIVSFLNSKRDDLKLELFKTRLSGSTFCESGVWIKSDQSTISNSLFLDSDLTPDLCETEISSINFLSRAKTRGDFLFQYGGMSNGKILGCEFKETNFVYQHFDNLNMRKCSFSDCTLEHGAITNLHMEESTFDNIEVTNILEFDNSGFLDCRVPNFILDEEEFKLDETGYFGSGDYKGPDCEGPDEFY